MNTLPIEIFVRHCFHSNLQECSSRVRPKWWNKEKVFHNFKKTANQPYVNYTILYDEFYGKYTDTFLKDETPVIFKAGGEAKSFLYTLDYVLSQDFHDETIIYFVEDDYLHRPNWETILREGFTLPVSYVTLYDHRDKYSSMYHDLMAKILITKSSHWRPTPSTTNTFATQFKTLKKDYLIHKYFSNGVEPSADHQKFLNLNQKGQYLISSIPGYSTHAHLEHLSPCIDWETILKENS